MMEFEDHPTEPNTIIIKTHKRHIAKHSDEDLQAAILAEREACAKLLESTYTNGDNCECWLESMAEKIKARGEK